ncbi:MAG: transcription-repair coupling factor [Clostridiales bacterium]|nr:transcription-repair coupling factor [Clostridiales bacterium]MCF8021572.1 transcription-repair coupling factor [Clostridiales bacterium]
MKGLLKPLVETAEFNQLKLGLHENKKQQMVFGLTSSYRDYIMSALSSYGSNINLVITPGEKEASETISNLRYLIDYPVYHFPVMELLSMQVIARDKDVLMHRLSVLDAVCNLNGNEKVVVVSAEALMRRLCPRDVYCQNSIDLSVGYRIDPPVLLENLVNLGFERTDMVDSRGQVCLRGGIMDIYPLTFSYPVRIEFFDDEIDSIRSFDINTQRSNNKLTHITIGPALELVINEDAWERAREGILNHYQTQTRKLSRSGAAESVRQLEENINETLEYINNKMYFPGIEQFLPYFYSGGASLIDYLPENSLILMAEPQKCKKTFEYIQKEHSELHTQLLEKGKVLPAQYEMYLDWKQVELGVKKHRSVYFCFLPRQPKFITPGAVINITAKSMQSFMGKTDVLAEEISHWRRTGYAVVILVSSDERGNGILNELRSHKIDALYVQSLDREVKPGNIIITRGQLSSGFDLVNARLAVITEQDIYGQTSKVNRRRQKNNEQKSGQNLESFVDIKPGDYVVHVNHGIGKYLGMVPLDIGEIRKEYLLVKYSGEDKLYIPSDQLGLLQKYLGADADAPKLSKLGGNEWAKAKNRVKEAVREMADELLELYAARETTRGCAFSPDTLWQQEFEASFPYQETPDQLKAIKDVKRDMERTRPMDRLICGDVGYGKTEIALRAAFKCIMDGKQVSVLVPTTILAQQHFNTFRERFTDYPIRIEMLSRFKSLKEQKQVIDELARGTLDIVIGTHRLVQSDIRFNDLGLLVVDEEQRFGVAHKEKLKQIRTNVDVLTLTATPIPRTLHMSLVGVRDTSVLETPPENRYPVQTYVLEEDPVMIQEIIRREIRRGGQIYFVHNRIMDLDLIASWIKDLVPEIRLAVAHGQMKEDHLEQVMLDFMDGVYDILVCTAIIENGMDIANVNTLIVKESNNFGLAQLYQLRGRVGRSTRIAYAYITFRKDRILNEAAEKRLSAIKEFTEFGSGYKIAMRDLEIRGAGNILGSEQHGYIAAVGFDMYCQLLQEAVHEARGDEVNSFIDTVVELPVEAYIPDKYIPDENQKVEIYRRIAKKNNESQLDEIEEELTDRFGDLPEPVKNLIEVSRLKTIAGNMQVKTITKQQDFYKFLFSTDHSLEGDRLVKLGESYQGRIKFNSSKEGFEIRYKLKYKHISSYQLLDNLYQFLKLLA